MSHISLSILIWHHCLVFLLTTRVETNSTWVKAKTHKGFRKSPKDRPVPRGIYGLTSRSPRRAVRWLRLHRGCPAGNERSRLVGPPGRGGPWLRQEPGLPQRTVRWRPGTRAAVSSGQQTRTLPGPVNLAACEGACRGSAGSALPPPPVKTKY